MRLVWESAICHLFPAMGVFNGYKESSDFPLLLFKTASKIISIWPLQSSPFNMFNNYSPMPWPVPSTSLATTTGSSVGDTYTSGQERSFSNGPVRAVVAPLNLHCNMVKSSCDYSADITDIYSPLSPTGNVCTIHSPRMDAEEDIAVEDIRLAAVRSMSQHEDRSVRYASRGISMGAMVEHEVMESDSEDDDVIQGDESDHCDMISESLEGIKQQHGQVPLDIHEVKGVTFVGNHASDTVQKRILRRDTPTTPLVVCGKKKRVGGRCGRMWRDWQSSRPMSSMISRMLRRVKSRSWGWFTTAGIVAPKLVLGFHHVFRNSLLISGECWINGSKRPKCWKSFIFFWLA